MKKRQIMGAVFLFAVLTSIMLIIYVPKEIHSEHYKGSPAVFVHGYKGTYNSFGNLLNRFENKYNWGNKALVYRVSPEGKVNVYNLNKGKQEPSFVQVIFENNRASFADTAEWLSLVMAHMKDTYQINTVNLVGHSMGGLVSLKFIEDYQDPERYPRVTKFIAIGSPFDGIYNEQYFTIHRDAGATDLKPDSLALQLLRMNKEMIPEDLEVLSIGSTSDLVAVPESVQSLRHIIGEDQLQEIMIEDKTLGHSELHENAQVDKLIHSFLQSGNASDSITY
ncbi:alpha/beta hydrolase [Virgibacillus doumboii]|uniref:alpha/beta hydrolase n=1 Tax=Virgibacillus doumboii TaxID=2697503 RepID=UPI001FEA5EB3|nr:alpha/beta hydrolase [Virgibacillus doumboii]